MKPYKRCPACGKENDTQAWECEECGIDISNEPVIQEEIELPATHTVKMERICDCGFHNAPNARKCQQCGADISDIEIVEAREASTPHYILTSLDETYAYELLGTSVVFGREAEMQEYLSDKLFVSRRHAELFKEASQLYVKDLNAKNHTFVNNKQVASDEPVLLSDGDTLSLGGNELNGKRQDNAAYFLVRIGACSETT